MRRVTADFQGAMPGAPPIGPTLGRANGLTVPTLGRANGLTGPTLERANGLTTPTLGRANGLTGPTLVRANGLTARTVGNHWRQSGPILAYPMPDGYVFHPSVGVSY